MNKTAIRTFAVQARTELLKRVAQKALQYGISPTECAPDNAVSIGGKVLSVTEQLQRSALLKQIEAKGYSQVIEEVAYTWFNRFCALRFMEVNNYLPSRVRVFSDENNTFAPQILEEAPDINLPGMSRDTVFSFKAANDKEGLFKYLLITQCNALSSIMPGMFQRIADYTELLFPDNQLREGSVIHRLLTAIGPECEVAGVQLIGWLYQFYISEKKDAVFAKKGKVSKDDIPARTQLFTPDWIVRYMVENSLGRLWVQGHPDSTLKAKWRHYVDDAEQSRAVQERLNAVYRDYATLCPEDITCIDPCMGSGHILAYMFDVLVQIYAEQGYAMTETVRYIIEHNLYGVDIDERAAQLAYFTVMMKARQYDRRFFARKNEFGESDVPQPHIYAVSESNGVDAELIDFFAQGDANLHLSMQTIVHELHDAKEFGSLLRCSALDYPSLYARMQQIRTTPHMLQEAAVSRLQPLIQSAHLLSLQYDIAVTNPPYMDSSVMGAKLQKYAGKHYPDSKRDMFALFIERCEQFLRPARLCAMITQKAWMCLSSYEKLRQKMLHNRLLNMAHLDARAFDEIGGEVVKTTAFVQFKGDIPHHQAVYCHLVEPSSESAKEEMFLSGSNRYIVAQESFSQIPGCPVSYWASPQMLQAFQVGESFMVRGKPAVGMQTSNNDRFLRLWHEVSWPEVQGADKKWIKYVKGGSYRRWYGNLEYLLFYNGTPDFILQQKNARVLPESELSMLKGTWTDLASKYFSARLAPVDSFHDISGHCFYPATEERLHYLLGFCNTVVFQQFINFLNSSLHYQVGDVARIPVIWRHEQQVSELVKRCIELSKADWDSFENSWDFKRHPLLRGLPTVRASFDAWQLEAEQRFNELKSTEEQLNSIFINTYGLQAELSPHVPEQSVSVRKADAAREVRSLISYAVGCMFGRYSLDADGVTYAGGDWSPEAYTTFAADADNIIPICDDEYFTDDMVGLFVRFIETAYGKETLEENLRFIAEVLGGKGLPREVIRKYFRADFYTDHLKTYQKRPIYWMFDSGKKGGFRALIYMHRYAPDTLARMRTDYVHEQQSRYRTAIAELDRRMQTARPAEQVKSERLLTKLHEQDKELHEYEEKIHHLADAFLCINLDDGIRANYARFADVVQCIK